MNEDQLSFRDNPYHNVMNNGDKKHIYSIFSAVQI